MEDDVNEAIDEHVHDLFGALTSTFEAKHLARRGLRLAAAYAAAAFLWDELVWDINEAILIDLIAGPVFSKICFVEGTVVATPTGPKPIECLALGDEVTSQLDPQQLVGEGMELASGTEAISLVRLRYDHPDGTVTTMELLRSSDLAASLGLAPGRRLPVALPDMGLAAGAIVLAVEPYRGRVRLDIPVVTGRFMTDATDVVNVYLDGDDHPIGATPRHPLFSADRQSWIASADLQPGEQLLSVNEPAVVACVEQCHTRATVYNIEVSHYHTYFVGDAGVWAHNPCELTQDAVNVVKGLKEAGRLEGRSLAAFRSGSELRVGVSHYDLISGFPRTNFAAWEHGYVSFVGGQWVFRVGY